MDFSFRLWQTADRSARITGTPQICSVNPVRKSSIWSSPKPWFSSKEITQWDKHILYRFRILVKVLTKLTLIRPFIHFLLGYFNTNSVTLELKPWLLFVAQIQPKNILQYGSPFLLSLTSLELSESCWGGFSSISWSSRWCSWAPFNLSNSITQPESKCIYWFHCWCWNHQNCLSGMPCHHLVIPRVPLYESTQTLILL